MLPPYKDSEISLPIDHAVAEYAGTKRLLVLRSFCGGESLVSVVNPYF